MSPSPSCLSCDRAKWKRTANGRLHPDQQGKCQWEVTPFPIPSAFYWGYSYRVHDVPPRPSGGQIERTRPHIDCPLFTPIVTPTTKE